MSLLDGKNAKLPYRTGYIASLYGSLTFFLGFSPRPCRIKNVHISKMVRYLRKRPMETSFSSIGASSERTEGVCKTTHPKRGVTLLVRPSSNGQVEFWIQQIGSDPLSLPPILAHKVNWCSSTDLAHLRRISIGANFRWPQLPAWWCSQN